ncbi:MAG TPA: cupin domain-containing protein, partial [Bryobacteraceae bacterium]|nr:cupin domain-containing protein [Bryobacteraceae bacterium]
GATLILNKAHHSLPSLGETCRRLTRELRFLVGANIYMTPANARGFSKHRDDHDVLILQIDGRKTWIIYPADGPAVELELRPGDLLFLPRDFWHEARCESSSSVHVTLSLNASTGYELLEELTAVARERPEFRYPIHHGFESQAARQNFDLDFEGKVLALLREVTGSGLLERRFADLVKNQRQGWRGRFSDIVHLDEITPDTVLCARPEILSRVTSDGKSLFFEFADSRITVPVFLKSCLDRIASGEPFAVKELQGLITESGKLELIRQFVQHGFLAIVRR